MLKIICFYGIKSNMTKNRKKDKNNSTGEKMKIQLSEHFTYKKLIKFTMPTIIMMIFTSLYGVVDGIFVSNIIGSDAFAAINLIWPFIMILGSLGFMIGTGGSALVSKTIGEGNKEKANEYFSMLIYVLIIAGAILTILGMFLMKPISILLGAEGNMINYCVTYGRCILISLIPFLLQNCLQSFFVVAEKPKMGLIISIAVGLTNIIFDTIFIYFLQMGILGAALATAISQTVGGVSSLIYFIRKNDSPLYLTKAKFDGKAIIQASINGSSEMLTNVSLSLVNMLYNSQLMKIVGPNGVVAYGIIMYISFIFISTFIGYSLGSAPIISYHYGAGDKKELRSLLGKSLKLITITSIAMTFFAEIFAEPLASIFVGYDKELLDMTTTAIRIYSLSNLIIGFNIFASAFFTALNNGVVSAIISFLRTLLFQIAMIFILPAIWGLNGIWLAVVVAEILAIIVSGIFVVTNQKRYGYA